MLYIIIGLACVIGFAIYGYCDRYDGWIDVLLSGFIGLLTGFAFCIVAVFPIHCAVDYYAERTTYKVATHEISAFADNFEFEGRVNGNIFLTSGYVDEELKYGYMYAVEGKGYAYGSIRAKSAYLNKTKDTPRIETYDTTYANPVVNWLFPCVDDKEYIVYLPENAQITDEYIIDLK